MLMTIAELKSYVAVDNVSDSVLEAKLSALELLIRRRTNNNFQQRAFRSEANISDGVFTVSNELSLKKGDTIQVSESSFNEGLFTIDEVTGNIFTVKEETYNEESILITRIHYPIDLKMGVANMLKWDVDNRDKVGIQSESISRHSVTYFNMDGENSDMGYPKSLLGFLIPYMKARF